MKRLELADYFRPPTTYKKHLRNYLNAKKNGDKDKASEYLEKLAEDIGITYTTKTKKIDGKDVEVP